MFFFQSKGKDHHGSHDSHDDHYFPPEPEYDNVLIARPSSIHQKLAVFIGATFWLWIFWRFKHECETLIFFSCNLVSSLFIYLFIIIFFTVEVL